MVVCNLVVESIQEHALSCRCYVMSKINHNNLFNNNKILFNGKILTGMAVSQSSRKTIAAFPYLLRPSPWVHDLSRGLI